MTKRTVVASRKEEYGRGKQKRRIVTYDRGRMTAAPSDPAQDLQSEKGAKASPCQERKKKDKGSTWKQLSPLSSKRSARRANKHKDTKRKKSTSTSSSQSSKDSSEGNSLFHSEDHPPENPNSKPKRGGCNPYRNRWTGKIEKYSGSADGYIDTWLELMDERLDVSSKS